MILTTAEYKRSFLHIMLLNTHLNIGVHGARGKDVSIAMEVKAAYGRLVTTDRAYSYECAREREGERGRERERE